jgi:hypothetical protein
MKFERKLGMKRPLTILLGGMALTALVLGLGGGEQFSAPSLGMHEKVLLLMLGSSVTIAILGFRNWRPYTV